MDKFLLQLFTLNQQYSLWITLSGVLLLLLAVVMFALPALSRQCKEWRMVRCINNTAEETLRDVFLSDGVDGVHYFPFIMLTRQAIVFFKTMQFRGIIFAADTIDYWTQVVGKRSYKFHNPMPGLEAETASIKALDKKMQVEGRVVFTSDSHFPKGKPDAVMLETDIKAYLQDRMQGEIQPSLQQSWALLKAAASEGQQERQDKLLMSRPKALSGFRCRMAWLFSMLTIIWLFVRLS